MIISWTSISPASGILRREGSPTDLFIETVAGIGIFGFSGDGGLAIEAQLDSPSAIAVTDTGILYIADVRNNRIRRVDEKGIITTVAGTGSAGFNGDGGPAIEAELNQPLGVAVDADGNLYISDTLNHRVRKVDGEGKISTIAGNGQPGFGGDMGPAIEASFDHPVGIIIDRAGNLYIADVINHRIRHVDPEGVIRTIAGTGRGGFSGDGGAATEAQLFQPRDVAIDEAGNLYIADTDNNRIRKVDPDGLISTVAGGDTPGFDGDGGPASEALLNFPRGVAVDRRGRVYISDRGNNRIRRIEVDGTVSTVVGDGTPGYGGDGGPALLARLNGVRGVRVDPTGAIFIADLDNHRVRVVRSRPAATKKGRPRS